MVSFTIDRKLLKFPVPNKYKYQLERLYERADEKNNGYVTISLSLPKRRGTNEQNRAFHALLNEFFISNLHSYKCYEDMRDSFKIRAAGAKEYLYIDLENGKLRQHTCKSLSDIPENCQWCQIPKSWAEFNREERTMAIQLLITEGYNAGMNSRHWEEIMEGMNND